MAQTIGRQHKENLTAHLAKLLNQILRSGQTEALMGMDQYHHKHGDALEEFGKLSAACGSDILVLQIHIVVLFVLVFYKVN